MTTTTTESLEHMANLINKVTLPEGNDRPGMNLHILISNYNRNALPDPEKDSRRAKIIIRTVCEQMGISEREFVTRKTRQLIFIFTKMLITYFIRKHTDLTLRKIAEAIWHGSGPAPHHTTIIHSCKVCEDMIESKNEKHDFYRVYTLLSGLFMEEFGKEPSK